MIRLFLYNPAILLLLFIYSSNAEDYKPGSEVKGSLVVIKDSKGVTCLVDNPRDLWGEPVITKSDSDIVTRFYIKNAELKVGDTYTFSSRIPIPIPGEDTPQGMRIIKKLDHNSYEALFPLDQQSDAARQERNEMIKAQSYRNNVGKILDAKGSYYASQKELLKQLMAGSSLDKARLNAQLSKKNNILVFKDLYIGMPTADALCVISSLIGSIPDFDKSDVSSDIKSRLQCVGSIRLFRSLLDFDAFDHALTDLKNGIHAINLNENIKYYNKSNDRDSIELFYNDKDEVTAISLPWWSLEIMFKTQDIAADKFYELFTTCYNISSEFEQSRRQLQVYISSLPFIFGAYGSTDNINIRSLIDSRAVRITFTSNNGSTHKLFIQKWISPKDIKDSFK